mmetsp:Transcript_27863/g.89862  ORF Transcript_27863/g.89862 Transcript_27863/m.89862 type:complete len:303 (-) Transcript_27863:42-950(-)
MAKASSAVPLGGALIHEEEEEEDDAREECYPQKKYFRSRAHCNPLSHNDSFEYPLRPEDMDWGGLYGVPGSPSIVDVGCGFGGLSMSLATKTTELILALEIRPKVCEFVRRRVDSLRKKRDGFKYQNVACLRSNAMIYLPNLLAKGSLTKLFFCFPDPHFKAKNHRRRVVSPALLAEYAFVLRPGGLLYAITDVRQLHDWHEAKLEAHPCFERAPDPPDDDPFLRAMVDDTEEGKKVARNHGDKFWLVYQRKPDDAIHQPKLFGPPSSGPSSGPSPGPSSGPSRSSGGTADPLTRACNRPSS